MNNHRDGTFFMELLVRKIAQKVRRTSHNHPHTWRLVPLPRESPSRVMPSAVIFGAPRHPSLADHRDRLQTVCFFFTNPNPLLCL